MHEEGAEIEFISSNDPPVKEFPPFPAYSFSSRWNVNKHNQRQMGANAMWQRN